MPRHLSKGLISRGIQIVSGGTDNHLMLVDLTSVGKTGKEVENLLDEVNITCNKNTIPNDPQSAFVTSGVRLGTPAVTSQGNERGRHGRHCRGNCPDAEGSGEE